MVDSGPVPPISPRVFIVVWSCCVSLRRRRIPASECRESIYRTNQRCAANARCDATVVRNVTTRATRSGNEPSLLVSCDTSTRGTLPRRLVQLEYASLLHQGSTSTEFGSC